MDLLVLRVHRVFRQRLQMLPAAQSPQPSDIRAIVHGEIAAIALAIDGALRVRRPQLPAFCDGLAVRTNQPLRDVKAAAVALRKADHGREPSLLDRGAQLLGLRAAVSQ